MGMTPARIPSRLATITTGVYLLLKPQPMTIPVVGKFANEAVSMVYGGKQWSQ